MAKTTTGARTAMREPGWIETFLRPSDPAAVARRSELVGVIVVGLAFAFGAALWSYDPADMDIVHAGRGASGQQLNNVIGPVGARIADMLLHLFGVFAFLLDGLLLFVGIRTVLDKSILPRLGTFNGLLGACVAAMITTHLFARALDWQPHGKDAAGLIGGAVAEFMKAFLSTTGTMIAALVLLATAASALAGRPLVREGLKVIAARFGWLRQTVTTTGEGVVDHIHRQIDRHKAIKEIEDTARDEAPPALVPDIFAGEMQAEQTSVSTSTHPAFDDDDEPATEPMSPRPAPTDFSSEEVAALAGGGRGSSATVPAARNALETRVARPSSTSNLAPGRETPGFPAGTALRPNEMQVPTGVRKARRATREQALQDAQADSGAHEEVDARDAAVAPPTASHVQPQDRRASAEQLVSAPLADTDPTPRALPNAETRAPGAEDARPAQLGGERQEAAGFTPKIFETEAMRGIAKSDAPEPAEQGNLAIGGKKSWRLPRKSLLQEAPEREIELDADMLAENARTLLEKLHDFKIDGNIDGIRPGPVVTTYELKPAKGVRVNKITQLRDDLTMSLAAENVRIVAPIPGRDVVGIEVPNEQRQIVYFREVIESAVWQRSKSPLTIVLGKDIEGGPVVADLAKAPHLLVAGATGQGKSVGVNSMICSMLYKATPDDVKFIFIDPKVIELSVYEGIPHLLLPVLSDPDKATLALKWAVREMERRYAILHDAQVRNLDGYRAKLPKLKLEARTKKVRVRNGKKELVDMHAPGAEILDHPPEPENLPKLVVVIDEFADLILNTGKEVEVAVSRLAAKARACGIHIVLATQRPDTKVITGTIKANFPSRVAFKVSTKVDSGVILDQSGAETLLGKGDMLFWPAGKDIVRCHGTFVTDEEVIEIANHWKAQGEPSYDLEILRDPEAEEIEMVADEDLDSVFWEAVQVAIDAQQASVSFLQRKLKIGYQRSARIIDQMEARGIVGPSTGANRPREILDYNPAMPTSRT